MYTPFRDKKENPIEIANLYYRHLCQLVDIDEGYKIEYKETFDATVKKKIPAIMSSFANSDGGWLFVGIEDAEHKITPIPKLRSDYSQTISQILKSTVSPIPKFDCKFITNPKNKKEGVLAIYTYAGNFTPYVCNGTIYIRNGSSKEPIKSERSTIEFLYKKAEKFKTEIDRFCKREIYFPYTQERFGEKRRDYAICNIYLKKISKEGARVIRTMSDIESLNNYLQNKDSPYKSMQSSQQSVTFWHHPINPLKNDITMVWEIFYDLSMKFHIPISISPDYRSYVMLQFEKDGFEITESAHIFDGLISHNAVFSSLSEACSLLGVYGEQINDYALCMEIEDCENSILYFRGEIFRNYIKDHGLKFACKPQVKSDVWFLSDADMKWTDIPLTATYRFFDSSFGLLSKVFDEMHQEAMKLEFPEFYLNEKND